MHVGVETFEVLEASVNLPKPGERIDILVPDSLGQGIIISPPMIFLFKLWRVLTVPDTIVPLSSLAFLSNSIYVLSFSIYSRLEQLFFVSLDLGISFSIECFSTFLVKTSLSYYFWRMVTSCSLFLILFYINNIIYF